MPKQIPTQHSNQQGQSLVEYTLIVALVILAFVVAIAATGPAIGNVFSNTVYNLLGTDPDDIEDLPDKDEFWKLVTWVSKQTPVEVPLPTSTLVPNTEVPTAGPSPTPTKTDTPVPTVPTNTPTPSPTPKDFEFIAPWHDSADESEYWRLGGDVFLGTDKGWYAEYFTDTSLSSSSPSISEYTSEIDIDLKYNLTFNWGSGSPEDNWPVGDPGNNFGISFRRQIYLEEELTLLFKLESIDDGARIWLLDGHGDITTTRPNGCSTGVGTPNVTWGGAPSGSGNPIVYDDDHATYSTDCLLLDGWWNIAGKTATVKRTVPAGSYTVVVDMYDNTGNAKIKIGIDAVELSGNPDNTAVDGSGNVTSDSSDCRWGNVDDTIDSNSSDFRWDSWESGDNMGIGHRCFLELRGSVEIPAGMIDPVLTFWDVWDFRDTSMKAWVEISKYDPDNDGIFDRNALSWTRQDLHVGNSTNYNWTYQHIDLRTMLNLSGTDTMENTKYAIRFGMEVPQASYSVGLNNGYRLWWVDSINIDVAPQTTFYTAQKWDLNSPEQADDFITSGRWELSAERTRGSGGLSWNDSSYANYEITNLDGCSGICNFSDQNLRMHTLEFNGIVDLDDPLGATDLEGDGGDTLLSFWQSYELDDDTGLEVQYSTDLTYDSGEAPVWKLVPDGQISPRQGNNDYEYSLTFTEINLEALKALEPSANGRFRIRFAMTTKQSGDLDTYAGWFIDDIQLERDAVSRFLYYPYVETFQEETILHDWLMGGDWGRTDERAWRPVSGTEYSLADSPEDTYAISQESTALLRLALDVNNDSPTNPYSPDCTLIPSTFCDETDNVTPDDPIMTFQWWHDFGSDGGENLYVEWKKSVDSDNVWNELWAYRDRMSYNSSSDSSTRRQWNWQRVEIDLRQIWADNSFDNNLPDSTTDDDILFRFRFVTNSNNNSGTAEGVYIDEIHIEERDETSVALWDAGVSADVENPSFPSSEDTPPPGGSGTSTIIGDGVSYRDNLDDRANELFDNWYLGGTWEVIDWEQADGVLAFHDSTSSPLNSDGDPETPPPNPSDYTRNSPRSYNVLEMSSIIDLRATQSDRKPIMTFWQRHHIGYSTHARVQIAYEDPDTIGTSSHCFSASRDQCYEHLYGWSTWQTAPPWNQSGYNDWNLSGEKRQYLWKREIVDLSAYAATASAAGKRIRVRFISDSMDRGTGDTNLKDGWYIDNVEFKYNIPSVINIDVDTGDSFFDAARNTRNWVTEGTWGLSPEFFRGSGGGPADFGGQFWEYWIYDMNLNPPGSPSSCSNSSSGYRDCVKKYFDGMPDPDTDPEGRLKRNGLALDINNDWGSGGPGGLSSKFAGIWEITTPVIGTTMNAGNYTFVMTYDEALRAKYDTVPAGLLPTIDINGDPIVPDPYDPKWNIYNDFNTGGRQIGVGNALFETGKQYKIRMEYFDRWGDAAFIVSLGSSSFSFTDSPKQASGAAFPEIPAAPRSQSSMIFNGVFDLKDAVSPILQYYTYYELGGTGRVEVTTDGGFKWTQTGLIGSVPPGFWTDDWSGDFWSDSLRLNDEKMAYDISSGSPEWDITDYPPDQSVASYSTTMDFDWGNNPPVSGWKRVKYKNGVPELDKKGNPKMENVKDKWSAQFRRSFTLATAMEITIRVTSDDGHRLWLDEEGQTGYYPQCAFLDFDPTKPLMSGQPRVSGEDDEVFPDSGCILISDWEDGGSNYKEVTRTISAGDHEFILDYYEKSSSNKLKFELLVGNFDNPNMGGYWMPNQGDWQQRVHSFEAYAGYEADGDPKPLLGLRFRLDRLGESESYPGYTQRRTQYPTNWMESWWITDITVVDTISGP
jgi:hypothetical protein